jgi:hypothetical protein
MLDVKVKSLFWEEEHNVQLLTNTNTVWTIHIKNSRTVCQKYSYK